MWKPPELPLPAAPAAQAVGKPRYVGRGRSGVVYRDEDASARPVARKIFTGEGLSRCVLYLLTGAPNPYGWSRDAIQCALYRRRILRILVRFWFGDELRVPRTLGAAWNAAFRAYEIRAQFVAGRHLPLRHSAHDAWPDLIRELTTQIMKPLQARLIAAGMDGMVWQAGLGNPVAAGNFMVSRRPDGSRFWSWIDLESGVPALFPMNLWSLLSFYLPRSIHHRRVLFDDIDIAKLRRYVNDQRQAIETQLGSRSIALLCKFVDRLEHHQQRWKSLSRTKSSLTHSLAKGQIDKHDAQWYLQHPWWWQARLIARAFQYAGRKLVSHMQRVTRWCSGPELRRVLASGAYFLGSSRFRRHVSRSYVTRRIRSWRQRHFLNQSKAQLLRKELRNDVSSQCITDFGVHLAIKPILKLLQWWVVPLLFLLGVIDQATLAVLLASGGMLGRTAYTSLRCLQATLAGQRKPWFALAWGLVPVFGSVAFPLQLVFWSKGRRQRLAQFLVYDTFAGAGRAVPVWGGNDSLLESWSNRLPNRFFRWWPIEDE